MRSATTAPKPPTARGALVGVAVLLLVVKDVVPFGAWLLYPFTLLASWVHEMGHGLTALLIGGHFQSLAIFADASGLAYTAQPAGWASGLVSAGGLLAPPLAGAALLGLARGPRRARTFLALTAAAMTLSMLVWVRSVIGWIALPAVAVCIGLVALRGGTRLQMLAAQFLGVFFALDTVSRIGYCFTAEAYIGGAKRASDVANMAAALGGTGWLWGVVVAGTSLGLLALGLWMAWRKPRAAQVPWPATS